MKIIYNTVLYASLLVFTVLWLSSYTHHSAIGIDHDQQVESGVLHYYYRLNWTGHGSVWVGYGSHQTSANPNRKLEKLDPASALLKPVKPLPDSATVWNRLGFWYINSAKPTPIFWVGVPSWIPILLPLFLILLGKHRKRSGGLSEGSL
ncbi:hypothetical protein [Leucothrix arctica]|uniref:Uncharacterized protein n=1 Tax=Leucothrix arctica TaxID=1481894 RepID=A0A317CCY1_9GAMM|nr:hypothetical protein [Leucothrix arctica]PWQ93952.1 hypothetical protein DKT75_20360 [Leucothrix arctica]